MPQQLRSPTSIAVTCTVAVHRRRAEWGRVSTRSWTTSGADSLTSSSAASGRPRRPEGGAQSPTEPRRARFKARPLCGKASFRHCASSREGTARRDGCLASPRERRSSRKDGMNWALLRSARETRAEWQCRLLLLGPTVACARGRAADVRARRARARARSARGNVAGRDVGAVPRARRTRARQGRDRHRHARGRAAGRARRSLSSRC
jgi:hypothetical protein